jgi:hypothetical protein
MATQITAWVLLETPNKTEAYTKQWKFQHLHSGFHKLYKLQYSVFYSPDMIRKGGFRGSKFWSTHKQYLKKYTP